MVVELFLGAFYIFLILASFEGFGATAFSVLKDLTEPRLVWSSVIVSMRERAKAELSTN